MDYLNAWHCMCAVCSDIAFVKVDERDNVSVSSEGDTVSITDVNV